MVPVNMYGTVIALREKEDYFYPLHFGALSNGEMPFWHLHRIENKWFKI